MANDKGWQRRSDEWIEATHISRLKKEKRAEKIRKNKGTQNKFPNKTKQ